MWYKQVPPQALTSTLVLLPLTCRLKLSSQAYVLMSLMAASTSDMKVTRLSVTLTTFIRKTLLALPILPCATAGHAEIAQNSLHASCANKRILTDSSRVINGT